MKYLPSVLAFLVMIAGYLSQPAQAYVSAHPLLAIVLASVGAILSHFSPQPQK